MIDCTGGPDFSSKFEINGDDILNLIDILIHTECDVLATDCSDCVVLTITEDNDMSTDTTYIEFKRV